MSVTFDVERRYLPIVHHETATKLNDTYLQMRVGAMAVTQQIALGAVHYRPQRTSDSVLLFMHPINSCAGLPLVTKLAAAGHHVLCVPSRYTNDSALIMEKVLADLGAGVQFAKDVLNYERVTLCGWSGGGSLMSFYQSQAERPTITHTPAGDPIDLTAGQLVPADAVMLLAAHAARHQLMTESMDPSISDEHDPSSRDRDLNLYAVDAVHTPPYTADFLSGYREAQIARNRRITASVKAQLRDLADRGLPDAELGFVVHGTMADPRWLDPAVDPNDRQSNWCYLGPPAMVNDGPVGLARFCSLRSWLSQWSWDDARGHGPTAVADVTKPMLVVGMAADDGCPPSHTRALYDGITVADKEFHVIPGADHYVRGRPEALTDTVELLSGWAVERELF